MSVKIEHPSVEERRARGKDRASRSLRPAMRAGRRPPTARIRSRCSRSRTRPVSPTWCRCATAG